MPALIWLLTFSVAPVTGMFIFPQFPGPPLTSGQIVNCHVPPLGLMYWTSSKVTLNVPLVFIVPEYDCVMNWPVLVLYGLPGLSFVYLIAYVPEFHATPSLSTTVAVTAVVCAQAAPADKTINAIVVLIWLILFHQLMNAAAANLSAAVPATQTSFVLRGSAPSYFQKVNGVCGAPAATFATSKNADPPPAFVTVWSDPTQIESKFPLSPLTNIP
jgi:hypothetical protein